MKKVILTLLGIVVALGLFAAIGYAGYRIGYVQGARVTVSANGNTTRRQLRPFDSFGPRRMPMRNFGFGFRRGFGVFPMMGFALFGPLMFLGRIVLLVLVIWFIYWLFTRSGWRLTRAAQTTTTQTTTTQTTPPPAPGTDNENQDTGTNP